MEPENLTLRVLIEMRDEMRGMRENQRLTTEGLAQIRDEVHHLRDDLQRLERRQSEDAIRLATELVAVAHTVGEVRDLLRDQRIDRQRLEDHEERIRRLEKRSA